MPTTWTIKPPIWEEIFESKKLISPYCVFYFSQSKDSGDFVITASNGTVRRFKTAKEAIDDAEKCYKNHVMMFVSEWMERV